MRVPRCEGSAVRVPRCKGSTVRGFHGATGSAVRGCRRLATYKRANLLVRDLELIATLVNHAQMPVR